MDDFSFGTLKGQGGQGEAMFEHGRPFVRFFASPELLTAQSKAEGKPVFRKIDMIEIQQPGQRDNCIRETQDWHKRAFKDEWAAYEAGQEQVATGTPLAVLFPANPEIVEGLKAQRIHTVEQLAGLSDHATQDMGLGASDFRTKAQRFLQAADKASAAGRVEAAEQAVVDMQARMAELEARLLAQASAAPPAAEAPTTPPGPHVEPMRRKASPVAA